MIKNLIKLLLNPIGKLLNRILMVEYSESEVIKCQWFENDNVAIDGWYIDEYICFKNKYALVYDPRVNKLLELNLKNYNLFFEINNKPKVTLGSILGNGV